MQSPSDSIFDTLHDPFAVRRRKMLPMWIKVFCWIFIVLFALILLGIVALIINGHVDLPMYGSRLTNPLNIQGAVVIMLYVIKGTIAIGLLTEKDWAVVAAMADAIGGIAFCLVMMIVMPFYGFDFRLRWELIFLIPYYTSMWKIKYLWRENRYAQQQALHNIH